MNFCSFQFLLYILLKIPSFRACLRLSSFLHKCGRIVLLVMFRAYQSLPVSNSESVCEYYGKKRGNFDFVLIWKFQVHVKVALQWKVCKSCYSLQYGRKPFTTIKTEKTWEGNHWNLISSKHGFKNILHMSITLPPLNYNVLFVVYSLPH